MFSYVTVETDGSVSKSGILNRTTERAVTNLSKDLIQQP